MGMPAPRDKPAGVQVWHGSSGRSPLQYILRTALISCSPS
jgi:hypothetical protein